MVLSSIVLYVIFAGSNFCELRGFFDASKKKGSRDLTREKLAHENSLLSCAYMYLCTSEIYFNLQATSVNVLDSLMDVTGN